MNRVNLSRMQEIGEQLSKQTGVLRILREEICQAEEKIKHMSYVDETKLALSRCKVALDENIRVLVSMETVLYDAIVLYCRTDERIADRYNRDTVIYPETRFEMNRITGMEEYQSLIQF